MFHRVSACLGFLIATVVSLSGCAAEDPGVSALAGGSTASTDAPAPEEESTDAEVVAEPEPEAPKNSECLVGEWIVHEAELQSFYDRVNVSQATFSISGDMRLTITEDTYQFYPDFALTLEIAGIDAVGEIVGDVNGSYSASEEMLTTSYEHADNVEFVITVMGQVFDGKEMNDTFLSMFAINEAPYTCVEDLLTIGYQNVHGEAVVPVEFARSW